MKKTKINKKESTETKVTKLKAKTTAAPKKPAAKAPKKELPAVAFKIEAPEAQSVSVAGTFNDWQPAATPLKKIAGGKWSAKLTLAPGQYEYLFVVDNHWIADPSADAVVPNPFGGCNSLLQVA